MNIKEIAINRKSRKGTAHKITSDGAYWLALNIKIDTRGGDGVGQNGANLTDFYRVRHYRDGSVRAYCETESWHQNYGSGITRVRCDQTLECETIEDLIAAIKRVPLDSDDGSERYACGYRDGNYDVWESGEYSGCGDKALRQNLPELPESLPSPDEVLA